MNQFIARQPIFDRKTHVFGYELLYRHNEKNNFVDQLLDADRASSETAMTSFFGNGFEKITGGRPAFINFTQNLLEAGVATLFPPQYLVVEVLEDVLPLPSVVDACRELKQAGYMIALDDFVLTPEIVPLLQLADIVKIDCLNTPREQVEQMLTLLRPLKPRLLAEKIETRESFLDAVNMGFALFQGYFFAKPVILSHKKVDPLTTNYFQLIRLVNCPEIDFGELAHIIRRDAVLSYRLLRLVNSAYFAMKYEVKDIQHALTILGQREIRAWISFIAMTGISANKSEELIQSSMIRGRFMELFAVRFLREINNESFFMAGLFSLLDVIMEIPMSEIVAQMSTSSDISDVLLKKQGPAADVLDIISAYERGEWSTVIALCQRYRVTEDQLAALYLEAVAWCGELNV